MVNICILDTKIGVRLIESNFVDVFMNKDVRRKQFFRFYKKRCYNEENPNFNNCNILNRVYIILE
jgi:hypothetical protein